MEALNVLRHLIFITTPQSGCNYYPYFSEEETEVQERQRASLPKVTQLLSSRAILQLSSAASRSRAMRVLLVALMGSFCSDFLLWSSVAVMMGGAQDSLHTIAYKLKSYLSMWLPFF